MGIIRDNVSLIVALAVAAALKIALLAMNVVPFNADEAVVALMARHILQGERPVFFYGQAYLGSLDAWLIAGAFLLLGQTVLAIRVVQILLYLGTVATTYALGLRIYGERWTATAAALLMAIPTVSVTLYTTATLGGYGETLLIGNVLLLWAIRLREGGVGETRPIADATPSIADATRRGSYGEWAAFGFLAGLGFWAFGLLAVYLAPIAVVLAVPLLFRYPLTGVGDAKNARENKKSLRALGGFAVNLLSALIGFALGSSPWWWATIFGGAATVSELGGAAIAGASSAGWPGDIALRIFNLIVLGIPVIIGLRPSWAVRWLALPLAPLALAVFIGAVGRAVGVAFRGGEGDRVGAGLASANRGPRKGHPYGGHMLLGVSVTLIAAFVLTPFGADPSGRYFLPLAAPLALLTGDLLNRVRCEYPRAAAALLVGLLAFNLWGNVESALGFPPGLTTQFDAVAQIDMRDLPAVMGFLISRGETRGYTNYWAAFPMALLSDEQLIYSAALPYHLDFRYTTRDDRYPPYTAAAANGDRAAYVTTKHPPLDARLRLRFAELGVTFSETTIGDFHIFYGLSRKVTPDEIGLGE